MFTEQFEREREEMGFYPVYGELRALVDKRRGDVLVWPGHEQTHGMALYRIRGVEGDWIPAYLKVKRGSRRRWFQPAEYSSADERADGEFLTRHASRQMLDCL